MDGYWKTMIVSSFLGVGLFFTLQYLYDNRSNKCMVSVADAMSSRPEMVELRKRCRERN